MNNEIPNLPKDFSYHKSKHIVAIVLGILAVIIASVAYLLWPLYFFSVGLLIASIIFALKYFEMNKLSIVATIIAMSASLVIGYSIIRTGIVLIQESLATQYYYESYDYDDLFNDFYNDGSDYFGNDSGSSDFWE